MKSPLQALIQMGVVPTVTFPTDSRYYGTGTLTYVTPAGETITYLARRIVPQPGAPNFATIASHSVRQGDRLDLITARTLGVPEQFWQVCDANNAMNPFDLTGDSAVGTIVKVPLPQIPQGVVGATQLRASSRHP